MKRYDEHMMRGPKAGSNRAGLEWAVRPSVQLRKFMKLQNGNWTKKRGVTEAELRQFFTGMVNRLVMSVFGEGGLERTQWEQAAREHGEFMKGWFWEAKKLRDEARGEGRVR